MSYEVGSAAVALSKLVTDSPQTKELLSRVLLAIVTNEKHRGKAVQQGCGKVSAFMLLCIDVVLTLTCLKYCSRVVMVLN